MADRSLLRNAMIIAIYSPAYNLNEFQHKKLNESMLTKSICAKCAHKFDRRLQCKQHSELDTFLYSDFQQKRARCVMICILLLNNGRFVFIADGQCTVPSWIYSFRRKLNVEKAKWNQNSRVCSSLSRVFDVKASVWTAPSIEIHEKEEGFCSPAIR